MRDVLAWVGWIVLVIGGIAIFLGVMFGADYFVSKYSCNKLEQNTGIETKYVWFGGGCLVKVNDRFIPRENWRGEYQQ